MSSRAPHLDVVRSKLSGRKRLVLDADMSELMTKVDLAIGAAGASAYERAVLGLPSIVVTLADNQGGIYDLFRSAGAIASAGSKSDVPVRLRLLLQELASDPEKRMRMARCASALVDGLGPKRIRGAGIMTSIPQWWKRPRRISVVVDNPSWIVPFAEELVVALRGDGDDAALIREYAAIPEGAIAYFLGCLSIARADILARNRRNLVVHESDLPDGTRLLAADLANSGRQGSCSDLPSRRRRSG